MEAGLILGGQTLPGLLELMSLHNRSLQPYLGARSNSAGAPAFTWLVLLPLPQFNSTSYALYKTPHPPPPLHPDNLSTASRSI